MPLLKMLSDSKASDDVKFRSGALLLQPGADGIAVAVLVEVPLHELQPKPGPAKAALDVHCSLVALVKDAKGEVVQKLARDRGFQVTADQLKLGNFLDKMTVTLPAGKYSLESAVMDREKRQNRDATRGIHGAGQSPGRGDLVPHADAILHAQRQRARPQRPIPVPGRQRYADHGFDGQEGTEPSAPPVLHRVSGRVAFRGARRGNRVLQAGKVLTKVPMQLPAADAQGRIPFLMTIPAESILPGSYEVRATARQGASSASASTMIQID